MLPEDFHPVIQRWWADRFAEPTVGVMPPTEAQLDGWQAIRRGQDTLIAAPTGSGKTLAAFLTAIDELFREGLEPVGDAPQQFAAYLKSEAKKWQGLVKRIGLTAE